MLSHRSGGPSVHILVVAVVVGLAVAACSTGTPTSPASTPSSFAGTSSTTGLSSPSLPSIVGSDEPGPRLTVEGRVVDSTSGEPIEGARVVVYQTDQAGTYQPEDPDDESTARIRGEFTTGRNGEFGFVTVQPGEYPDQPPGNRHIHFHSITSDGYAAKGFVLLFDDNVRADVREWAASTGFGIVVPVTGDPDDGLATRVDIPLNSGS